MTEVSIPEITETQENCRNCSFFNAQKEVCTRLRKVDPKDSCGNFLEKKIVRKSPLAAELISSVLSHKEKKVEKKSINELLSLKRKNSRSIYKADHEGEDLKKLLARLVGNQAEENKSNLQKEQEKSSLFQLFGSTEMEKQEKKNESLNTCKIQDDKAKKQKNEKKRSMNPFELLGSGDNI